MLRSLLGTVVVLTGTLAAAGMLPAVAGQALTGPPGISPDTQFTPVTGLVLTSLVPVKASDGKVHIAYELVLTNTLHSKWISTLSR